MAGNSLSPKLPWELANPKWAAALNPIIANPLNGGLLLSSIPVVAGTNIINHKLGRKLRGYMIVMNSGNVTFYDRQQTNQMPELTLDLVSSGIATISLYVF